MGVGGRRRGGRRRAGGARRRRRARARHHHHANRHRTVIHNHGHRQHNRLFRVMFGGNVTQNHHSQPTATTPVEPSSPSTVGSNTNPQGQRAFAALFRFGCFLLIPGTIMTCIAFPTWSSFGLSITGPLMLLLGLLMTIGTVFLSFLKDTSSKNPRQHANWNARVKGESETVSWILILVGSALACAAFIPFLLSNMGIASLCIIGSGELILILGLIHGRVQHESTPDTEPPPNGYGTLGWALVIPGICLSCVSGIRYNRQISGITGALMLTLGSALVIISAIKQWNRVGSSASTPGSLSPEQIGIRRFALNSVIWLCFLCGIILTPVGFTHLPPGLALGIAGACAIGIASLGHLIFTKCLFPQYFTQPTPDATNSTDVELGPQPTDAGTAVTNGHGQVDEGLPSYAVASGMPMPPSTSEFYQPQTVFAPPMPGFIYPNSGLVIQPSVPPPPPPPPPQFPSSAQYMPPPPPQFLSSAQYMPTPGPGTDMDNEPPPPSYDDVVKGMAGVGDISYEPPTSHRLDEPTSADNFDESSSTDSFDEPPT